MKNNKTFHSFIGHQDHGHTQNAFGYSGGKVQANLFEDMNTTTDYFPKTEPRSSQQDQHCLDNEHLRTKRIILSS